VADSDAKTSKWRWIGGAAIATFLIASVLPTAILQNGTLLCLDVGAPADVCMAPVHGTAELSGSQVTGLTMSMTTTAKVVLSLIAAGITALVLRRQGQA
jgi:hypothetical protein